MRKKKKKTNNDDLIVSLETAFGFDDDVEAVSGIKYGDLTELNKPIENEDNIEEITLKEDQIVKEELAKIAQNKDEAPKEPINSIHNLVHNARNRINDLKSDQGPNEHETMIQRLERLKHLRDSSQVEPNEFQQMLNRIKERNFNDRMESIMSRIKYSHRDDDKLELNEKDEVQATGTNLTVEPMVTSKNKDVNITNHLPNIKTDKTAITHPQEQIDSFTITLSVEQFHEIVKDTVEDVLIELGIKNKNE